MKKAIRINQQLDKLLSTLQQEQQVNLLLHFQEAVECEFKSRKVITKLKKIVENSDISKNHLLDIQQRICDPNLSPNDKNNLIKKINNYIVEKISVVMKVEPLTKGYAETAGESDKFVGSDSANNGESSESDREIKSQNKRKRESKEEDKDQRNKTTKITAQDIQIIQAAQTFQSNFHACSSNTAKLQKVKKNSSKDKYGYLQYITHIKPDANCENAEQKEVFGVQVKKRLKQPPYHLTSQAIEKNVRLITSDYKFTGEENRYKPNDKVIGYIAQPGVAKPGDVIIVGKTSCTVYEKSSSIKFPETIISDDELTERDASASENEDDAAKQKLEQQIAVPRIAKKLGTSISKVWSKKEKKMPKLHESTQKSNLLPDYNANSFQM